jgi:hypothetical protein
MMVQRIEKTKRASIDSRDFQGLTPRPMSMLAQGKVRPERKSARGVGLTWNHA